MIVRKDKSVLSSGVKLPDQAIVALGSVITGSVEDTCKVSGCPCDMTATKPDPVNRAENRPPDIMPEMRRCIVIEYLPKVALQDAAQVRLAWHNHTFQALAAGRADEPAWRGVLDIVGG